jgi:hypothetical protein
MMRRQARGTTDQDTANQRTPTKPRPDRGPTRTHQEGRPPSRNAPDRQGADNPAMARSGQEGRQLQRCPPTGRTAGKPQMARDLENDTKDKQTAAPDQSPPASSAQSARDDRRARKQPKENTPRPSTPKDGNTPRRGTPTRMGTPPEGREHPRTGAPEGGNARGWERLGGWERPRERERPRGRERPWDGNAPRWERPPRMGRSGGWERPPEDGNAPKDGNAPETERRTKDGGPGAKPSGRGSGVGPPKKSERALSAYSADRAHPLCSGDRIRTCDLWVMSPASYRAAPPRAVSGRNYTHGFGGVFSGGSYGA